MDEVAAVAAVAMAKMRTILENDSIFWENDADAERCKIKNQIRIRDHSHGSTRFLYGGQMTQV